MAENNNDNKQGWFGDSEGHARAGQEGGESRGNQREEQQGNR